MKFLYAAYTVTWIIQLVYLVSLWRGYKRVKAEEREFERER